MFMIPRASLEADFVHFFWHERNPRLSGGVTVTLEKLEAVGGDISNAISKPVDMLWMFLRFFVGIPEKNKSPKIIDDHSYSQEMYMKL